MKCPKILIISHNCFSKNGSNGRTLLNFFEGYPKNKLAQFYIYNEMPFEFVCENYFRVTDMDALKSAIPFVKHGGSKIYIKSSKTNDKKKNSEKINIPRTPLVYLIRNLFWNRKKWINIELKEWIKSFGPDLILFQAGDASFLYEFVGYVSSVYNIPYIIYNSENYYFKNYNYLSKKYFGNFFYKLLHKQFKKITYNTISKAKYSIYISEYLQKLYNTVFDSPSEVIMTSSAIKNSNKINKNGFSYLGNLGLGRYKSLMKIGMILNEIDNSYYLDIYGSCDESIKKSLENAKGIRYKGIISYTEVLEVMRNSLIVFHVESFDDFYKKDSKYAFSTKIADSISIGTCLFVYAPREIEVTKYLDENMVACIVVDEKELKVKLKEIINDKNLRNYYVKNALILSEKNHNFEKNKIKFFKVIDKVGVKCENKITLNE